MKTVYLEEVDSTNLYAKRNLKNLSDKTVIHADVQTNGRGRLQRSWVDLGKGNLFLSFVLKPSENFNDKYSNLTQYLSVVLCKILEEYGLTPQIKWPNDVLINGKKIAGILCETVVQGNSLRGLILGIGVNLNAEPKSLEKITDKEVCSLNLEINRQVDKNGFMKKLTSAFFENYETFLSQGFDFIKNDYISRTNFLEKEICVQILNGQKCGLAKEINDKGELVLLENDKSYVLTIGDIL